MALRTSTIGSSQFAGKSTVARIRASPLLLSGTGAVLAIAPFAQTTLAKTLVTVPVVPLDASTRP